jgi:hypothetical protein
VNPTTDNFLREYVTTVENTSGVTQTYRFQRLLSQWCGGLQASAWAVHGGILPNARKVEKEGDIGI